MSTALVTVRLFAAARAAVGQSEVDVEPGSLATIIEHLSDTYARFSAVAPRCSYLVNHLAVHEDLDHIAVHGGDIVDVLPPFAGG